MSRWIRTTVSTAGEPSSRKPRAAWKRRWTVEVLLCSARSVGAVTSTGSRTAANPRSGAGASCAGRTGRTASTSSRSISRSSSGSSERRPEPASEPSSQSICSSSEIRSSVSARENVSSSVSEYSSMSSSSSERRWPPGEPRSWSEPSSEPG